MVIEYVVIFVAALYIMTSGTLVAFAIAKVQVSRSLLKAIGGTAHAPSFIRIRNAIVSVADLEKERLSASDPERAKSIRAAQVQEITEVYRSYVKNDVTFQYAINIARESTRNHAGILAQALQHWLERTNPTPVSRPAELPDLAWPTSWFPQRLRRWVAARSNMVHERGFAVLLVKCYGHRNLASMSTYASQFAEHGMGNITIID